MRSDMAVGRALSVGLIGVDGTVVDVEADVGRGLPGMYIGGLGDAAVGEARERVRTAAANSSLHWPKTKVVVSLSPANLRKYGTGFDLAIVCAVLSAAANPADPTEKAEIDRRLRSTVLIGEVGLDGAVRPVPGVLPAVLAAREAGLKWAIVPVDNGPEAHLVPGITVGTVSTIQQLWHWATTGQGVHPPGELAVEKHSASVDMADVHGQTEARGALEIAAAGGHHLFLVGSPGTGKSMLAERLPTILPPLDDWQRLETAAVYSVLRDNSSTRLVREQPPFVAPHHSTTVSALIGGGNNPQPGAISLAHHGVLFLDEVTLMKQQVLDALRTPLETGQVHLMRSQHQVRFPCSTQLVMAANPCACGAAQVQDCTCCSTTRSRYQRALSGPLRDRIDLTCSLTPSTAIMSTIASESSEDIRARVVEARQRAYRRWRRLGYTPDTPHKHWKNADIPGSFIRRNASVTDDATVLLEWKLKEGELTQRGIDKVLKVAWTIADLQGVPSPTFDHVLTACEFHSSAHFDGYGAGGAAHG